MSNHTINLDKSLFNYLLKFSLREDAVLKELREFTLTNIYRSDMQIAPEQGQFMNLLTKIHGAKKCIEIGVFTGYSSICVSKALPMDGILYALDNNIEWTNIAKTYWEKANVSSKIELKIGDAVDTLLELIHEEQANSFDFVFIDADKKNYSNYYDLSLKLLKPGGIIVIDNVLWSGKVLDKSTSDEETVSIKALNEKIIADETVDISMVPIGDGITIVRKK